MPYTLIGFLVQIHKCFSFAVKKTDLSALIAFTPWSYLIEIPTKEENRALVCLLLTLTVSLNIQVFQDIKPIMMASSRQANSYSLLIAQVEPPQREHGGDYYYRTLAPGIAMAKEEGVYVINLTNVHRQKNEIMRKADILVLKNICDPDVLPIIGERKEQKKITVYEVADDLCAVPPWNLVYFFYRNQENLLLFKRIAHFCDAMQFSVPELKRLYGYLNQSSAVFCNQISIVPPAKGSRDRSRIIIGWGGSDGHLEDMAEVSDPLINWISARADVHLYLMCSDRIWSLFERLPKTRKKRFKTGSIQSYYAFLKEIDIGLAPLKDTAFNRSRSDVKFLEYAVSSVVPVVQASEPYQSTVKHGETGFLFKDLAGLLHILEILAENLHLIHRVARAARDYVMRERLQQDDTKERTDFYKGKFGELNGREVTNDAEETFKALANIEGTIRRDRHLRLMPTRFENLLHDGLVLSQLEGKALEARSLFSEASRLDPSNYLPCLYGFSCSTDPCSSLLQAIEREPNSPKSWILLGEEFAKKGDIARSVKCFESAAQIFPEYEIPYLRTATLLEKIGHKQESTYLTEKADALIRPLLGPS